MYVAMVTPYDDGCREAWNPFYMDFYVADTEDEATWIASYELATIQNEEYDEEQEYYDSGDFYVVKER